MASSQKKMSLDGDDSLLDDDVVDESLWESPVKPVEKHTQRSEPSGNHGHSARATYVDQQAREETLRQELASVRKVNEAIESVIESLEKAKENMKTVNTTVTAASSLLNSWTRILSQTEHNQRLILSPSWQGASQDIADMEEETLEKQRAAERREAEEQERRTAAARRAEEEEKRKAAAEHTLKPSKPATRGRGRSSARGTSTVPSRYGQMGGSAVNTSASSSARGTSSTRRTTSGIGRGVGSRGGRGRG